MPWLAKIDARAKRCPRVVYWPYLVLKWYLVFVGAWGLIYAYSQNAITQLLVGLSR
jgi:hypothetical protein